MAYRLTTCSKLLATKPISSEIIRGSIASSTSSLVTSSCLQDSRIGRTIPLSLGAVERGLYVLRRFLVDSELSTVSLYTFGLYPILVTVSPY